MKQIDLNRHYVSIVLLSLLLLRVIIVGASIGEALSILALAGFAGYSLFISNKNRDLESQIKEHLESQAKSLELLEQKTEAMQKIHLEINDLRQQVGIMKIDKAFGQVQATSMNNFRPQPQQSKDSTNVGVKKKIF